MSALSNMRRDLAFLASSLLLLGSMSALVALAPTSYARILVALPLVMVMPGAAILNTLRIDFPAPGRCALVIGLSMATTVLGGLLLALAGWLTPLGWLLWFSVATLGGGLFALGRSQATLTGRIPRIRVRHIALCAAIVGVTVLALQNAMRHHDAYLPFPYTDFWMLPAGQASNLYTIGIKNGERVDEQFTVRVMVDGAIVGVWQVEVPADQTVTHIVMLPAGHRAIAWLFRASDPAGVYRTVSAALHDTA
jgi:hypothetical protein